ncbi:MAG: nucleotidyltransferase family protein [Rhodospirillales bacterium]|nr:nucleotidyltransferase family protein [Rhodospirillales bacterium]
MTAPASTRHVAAVILAAGYSRRMEGGNKLLAKIGATPLITRVVDAALQSKARPVIVVIGHEGNLVASALDGRDVTFAVNHDPSSGLSSSIKAGIAALPDTVDGVLICLGDMPRLRPDHLNRLIDALNTGNEITVCAPIVGNRRGNPILWTRRHFPELMELSGDRGARDLVKRHKDSLREVPMPDDGVFFDVDTLDALETARLQEETS